MPGTRQIRTTIAIATGLLLVMAGVEPIRALDLGGTWVDKDRMVVYLFIGHSNMLSDNDPTPIHSRAWNFYIPDDLWVPAANPLHIGTWGIDGIIWSGPGKPFLQKMAQAYPGYHIGMLQNPNNRTSVTMLDPRDDLSLEFKKGNRYCKSCPAPHTNSALSYDEIISRAIDLDPHVTLGGVVVMLGFMEAKESAAAGRFADDFVQMVHDIRSDLGKPDLPVLIGQGCFESDNKGPYWETVRAQIFSLPGRGDIHNIAVVDLDLNKYVDYIAPDNHHYNDVGHAKFAQRALDIIQQNGWFPVADEPTLSLDPAVLPVSAEVGGSAPEDVEVTVSNAGTGTLEPVSVSVSYDGSPGWLSVMRSGSGNLQILTNRVNTSGLLAGAYSADVTVSCPNAVNGPLAYTVDLQMDVALVVSSIDVQPASVSLKGGRTQVLLAEAFDQHGLPIHAAITWSAGGAGGLDPSSCGPAPSCSTTFTAGDVPGTYSVTASAGGVSGNAAVTVEPPPAIHLSSPAGGETWRAGETHHIDWTVGNLDQVVLLYYDGIRWHTIEPVIGNGDDRWGHYPWVVPDASTAEARVRITDYGGGVSAESGPFTIEADVEPVSLGLLAPLGGEVLTAGAPASVRWEATGLGAVRLTYSLDAGRTWESIATVARNDAHWSDFAWTLPAAASRHCLFRVQSMDGGHTETSGRFTLQAPQDAPAGSLEVVRLALGGFVPTKLGGVENVTVLDAIVPVVDGAFGAEVDVPAGVRTLVFEVRSGDGGGEVVTRLVRLDVDDAEPPVDGLDVSARELRSFLGDRGGILAWVDVLDEERLKVLDFRSGDPVVRTLGSHTDVVNPRISPDGTRVIYSVGHPNGAKDIFVASLADGEATWIASGDVGYWLVAGGDEFLVYCDWVDGTLDGEGGNTYRQKLVTGGLSPDGSSTNLHDRAMDAGSSADGIWLGQVYKHLFAYNTQTGIEYSPSEFSLFDDSPATGQVCNGSMAPDGTGRMMVLTIPHDWVRIFTPDTEAGRFEETSRFQLPSGQGEWSYPEWSTHPGIFTAVLQPGTLKYALHLAQIEPGDVVPRVLRITPEDSNVSYSHLYVQP